MSRLHLNNLLPDYLYKFIFFLRKTHPPSTSYPIPNGQPLKHVHLSNTKWTQQLVFIYLYTCTNLTIIVLKRGNYIKIIEKTRKRQRESERDCPKYWVSFSPHETSLLSSTSSEQTANCEPDVVFTPCFAVYHSPTLCPQPLVTGKDSKFSGIF